MVRTGYRVYGQKICELAPLMGHSRNTIKKAIRGEPWGYSERQHQPFPVIGEYMPIIERWLEHDKTQPSKQRHTARRVLGRMPLAPLSRAMGSNLLLTFGKRLYQLLNFLDNNLREKYLG